LKGEGDTYLPPPRKVPFSLLSISFTRRQKKKEKIILKCLEKEPENRPQSAAEAASLLANCPLEGEWGPQQASEWRKLHLAI